MIYPEATISVDGKEVGRCRIEAVEFEAVTTAMDLLGESFTGLAKAVNAFASLIDHHQLLKLIRAVKAAYAARDHRQNYPEAINASNDVGFGVHCPPSDHPRTKAQGPPLGTRVMPAASKS